MVKVPATPEGIPAIQQLISEGINVNVTLLFAQEMYEKVALAYIAGLKKYVAGGGDPSHVSSVASFFISRIDSMVDAIDEGQAEGQHRSARNRRSCGACWARSRSPMRKLTYQRYKEIFSGPRLGCAGEAKARRRNACCGPAPAPRIRAYSRRAVRRGADRARHGEHHSAGRRLEAFRDHGKPKASLEADLDAAQGTMETLEAAGISMKKVTDDLVTQAVKLFAEPFDKLLNAVDAKCKFASQAEVDRADLHAARRSIGAQLSEAMDDWKMAGKVRRLWARDASLWTGTDESNWLGWLGITEDQLAHKQHLEDVADGCESGADSSTRCCWAWADPACARKC